MVTVSTVTLELEPWCSLLCSGLGRLFLRLHSRAGDCGKVPRGSNPRSLPRSALIFWALNYLVATGPRSQWE